MGLLKRKLPNVDRVFSIVFVTNLQQAMGFLTGFAVVSVHVFLQSDLG